MVKKIHFLSILMVIAFQFTNAQITKKVLFLGNSYTAVNDIPSMVNAMAVSTNDVLIFDSNTPGGYRFMNHASNTTTLSKINSNTWDYVVLQAQSQETSLEQTEMEEDVFPYATILSNQIRQNNACSQPLFYMTWGRQNGDSNNCPYLPWVCTYEGMDNAIKSSYEFMAEENEAELAPVGAVWRYLRANNPSINLYSSDESHPSLEGSYAAACALYTMIYKKDPTLINWNSSLSPAVSLTIKQAAKTIVFDQIALWDFTVNPATADFTESIEADEVSFTNESEVFDALLWDFGDGTTSIEINPVHSYASSGTFVVSLTVLKCGKSDVKTKMLTVDANLNFSEFYKNREVLIFPNPTNGRFKIDLISDFRKGSVAIYNCNGMKLLVTQNSDAAFFDVDIAGFNAGLYILKITVDDKTFFSKVVKN